MLREGPIGKLVRSAEIHGPISERTAAAFRACLTERDRDAFWMEEELRKSEDKVCVCVFMCEYVCVCVCV